MTPELTTNEASLIKQKILVIDDEETYRDIIVMALQSSGFEVSEASNGMDGLGVAKSSHPDLILCDINMPKMDGHTLLSTLKEDPAFAGIPFIFLTGNAAKSDMRKGMQLGADDYLTKPFTTEELLSAVEARLSKKRSIQKHFETQFDEIKSSIVKSLPHEFRTPLNGILGFSQILQDENDVPPEEVRKIAALIYKSGERLHHLLENMILFGQIQFWVNDPEKKEKMRRDNVSSLTDVIPPIVQKCMQTHGRIGAVRMDITNAFVTVSSIHLTKIIEEMVDNALKFSEAAKEVRLNSRVIEGEVRIVIQDEGRGISPEQLAKISAFHQFDRNYYEQQGAGLGLVIARKLTEIYGGHLAINSEERKGTTVTITLPKAV